MYVRVRRRRPDRGASPSPLPGAGLGLLGPAFVAAVAYVDPGNVATNLSAGAGSLNVALLTLTVTGA